MALYPFWKVTPSGNPTILLRAEDVSPAQRASVAADIMDPQHIGGEQVGYVRFSGTPRLDMMGGEFCLNATRAFAAVLAEQGLLERNGRTLSGAVEVSGADGLVAVRVVERENALPLAEACLHFDELPSPEQLGAGISLVRLPGIAHIVQNSDVASMPAPAQLAAFCEAQRLSLALEQEDAVGHLWLKPMDAAQMPDSQAQDMPRTDCQIFAPQTTDTPAPTEPASTEPAPNAQDPATQVPCTQDAVERAALPAACPRFQDGDAVGLVMEPVVWVRDTASLCPESACGSGTLACALAEHAASGALRFSVLQPSGCVLSVRLEKQTEGWDVWVGGPVRITASGNTDLRALR